MIAEAFRLESDEFSLRRKLICTLLILRWLRSLLAHSASSKRKLTGKCGAEIRLQGWASKGVRRALSILQRRSSFSRRSADPWSSEPQWPRRTTSSTTTPAMPTVSVFLLFIEGPLRWWFIWFSVPMGQAGAGGGRSTSTIHPAKSAARPQARRHARSPPRHSGMHSHQRVM